jgi:transposase
VLIAVVEGGRVKSAEETMEILEAYDLVGSLRGAARLAGCDHHTVRRVVAARAQARAAERRLVAGRLIDEYREKVEELVERSRGRIRADRVHAKLRALGYTGSERTTRRAVAAAKRVYASGQRRVSRPWIAEPGLWLQFDYGQGPLIGGRETLLFCAWLAWSRYRVVLPLYDKTLPSVIAALDETLRRFGGAPTYALTDNEKTVTVAHIAGIAVRNSEMVAAAGHYGITLATCVPADPQSKGGSEATVRIAKADLVPCETNLRAAYGSWGELERACLAFCDEVNARPHRATRRPPELLLAEERAQLHRIPDEPHTLCFGQTRVVSWSATISWGGVVYSVPHQLSGERVWARVAGEELIVVHHQPGRGAREIARHRLSTPGVPRILDEHYPPRPAGALARTPRATSPEEAAFLSIGPGAAEWLVEAAAVGAQRIKTKMRQAVSFAGLLGADAVDGALSTAARAGRFADGDLASLLGRAAPTAAPQRVDEQHSLQPGTAAWDGFGA